MDEADKLKLARIKHGPLPDAEAVYRLLERRLGVVESELGRIDTHNAVREEKRRFDESRLRDMDTRIDRIEGHLSKLVWLIVAAILGGFMSFVMKGAMLGV